MLGEVHGAWCVNEAEDLLTWYSGCPERMQLMHPTARAPDPDGRHPIELWAMLRKQAIDLNQHVDIAHVADGAPVNAGREGQLGRQPQLPAPSDGRGKRGH